MLEREQLIEIVVAVSVVFLMLGAMIGIGITYGDADSTLPPEGGQLLVGTIVGFIVLMTIIGVGLAFALNESENANANSS